MRIIDIKWREGIPDNFLCVADAKLVGYIEDVEEPVYVIGDRRQNLVAMMDGGHFNLWNCDDEGRIEKTDSKVFVHLCWGYKMFKTLDAICEGKI